MPAEGPAEDSDGLLPHYLAELDYLHAAGAEFAGAYPQVAESLGLSAKGSTDPHVERLIESFAFLTARMQRTYEAQFPEIPAALLGILYPQLTAPIPPMAVACFEVDPKQSLSAAGITVPSGTALAAVATTEALTCRFRTGHAFTLWPIEVADACVEPPALYPFLDDQPHLKDVRSVLRIRLRCLGNRRFGEMAPTELRFFLPPRSRARDGLYETLFTGLRAVAITADTAESNKPILCDARIEPVGWAPGDELLPCPPTSHQAYRLLQEYFAFPDKFYFFDLTEITPGALGKGNAADILLLLAASPPRAEVDAASFRLNCAPIVNLFPRVTEPIRLDETRLDYRLIPDIRFESSTEIHSIQQVTRARAQGGPAETMRPLFSVGHAAQAGGTAMYYARREPVANPDFEGSEILLSFVDPDLNPTQPATDTVFAHVTCTNRGLAEQIGEGTALHLEIDLPVSGVACLMRPTRAVAAPAKGGTLWRLVSHLSVNHLSLDGADGLAALREILHLYAAGNAMRQRQIAGLTSLATRRIVRHIGVEAWRGFCRGYAIEIEFDDQAFAGASAYLLGCVLSRFFGLYAAVDSFAELTMKNPRTGQTWQWPTRTGDQNLL